MKINKLFMISAVVFGGTIISITSISKTEAVAYYYTDKNNQKIYFEANSMDEADDYAYEHLFGEPSNNSKEIAPENVERKTEKSSTEETKSAPTNDGTPQSIVQQEAAKYGWNTGANWEAIDFIITHESSWNPNSQNSSSSAFGLFQMITETSSDISIKRKMD